MAQRCGPPGARSRVSTTPGPGAGGRAPCGAGGQGYNVALAARPFTRPSSPTQFAACPISALFYQALVPLLPAAWEKGIASLLALHVPSPADWFKGRALVWDLTRCGGVYSWLAVRVLRKRWGGGPPSPTFMVVLGCKGHGAADVAKNFAQRTKIPPQTGDHRGHPNMDGMQ